MFKKPKTMSKKIEITPKNLDKPLLNPKKPKPTCKQPRIVLTSCLKSLGPHQKVLDKSIPHPRNSSPCPKRKNHLELCEQTIFLKMRVKI